MILSFTRKTESALSQSTQLTGHLIRINSSRSLSLTTTTYSSAIHGPRRPRSDSLMHLLIVRCRAGCGRL